MTDTEKSAPKWILIISAIFALLEVMVSVMMIYAPQSALETVDLNAKGVEYVIQMWAVRQFALGFIFAYAVLRKSIPMLTIAYIFFLVMMVGDLMVGIFQNENSLIISAIVMCFVSSLSIFALNKRK